MTKILFVMMPGWAPVRTYRGEGVMGRLNKINPDIEVVYPRQDEGWKDLVGVDMVYMARAFMPQHVRLAQEAMDMGLPVWYDIDDNFFEIPPDNPAFLSFNQHKNLAWILSNADMVTVTTKELELYLRSQIRPDRPIEVVPNAIDDYHRLTRFDVLRVVAPKDEKTILWRGGISHQGDLLEFSQDYWDFLANCPDWSLLFFGADPYWLDRGFHWHQMNFIGRISNIPYLQDYWGYMRTLLNTKAPILGVPLRDNPFNRSKSNIAALEAICAWILPVVPDWENFDLPGVIHYQGLGKDVPNSYVEELKFAASLSPVERDARVGEAREFVRKNLSLSVVNRKRSEIAERLIQ